MIVFWRRVSHFSAEIEFHLYAFIYTKTKISEIFDFGNRAAGAKKIIL